MVGRCTILHNSEVFIQNLKSGLPTEKQSRDFCTARLILAPLLFFSSYFSTCKKCLKLFYFGSLRLKLFVLSEGLIYRNIIHTRTHNMDEYDWRSIDVDQYDPEKQFVPDDLGLPKYTLEDIQPSIQLMRQCTASGDTIQGIKAAVQSPPYGAANEVKSAYLQAALDVLSTSKQSTASSVISKLSQDEQDVLVKLVFALMDTKAGQKVGGSLLGWLNKVVEASGEGSLVRYLSDPYKL